jgi:hypothetical protein
MNDDFASIFGVRRRRPPEVPISEVVYRIESDFEGIVLVDEVCARLHARGKYLEKSYYYIYALYVNI